MMEGYTLRNVSVNAATSAGDRNAAASSGDDSAAASARGKLFGNFPPLDIRSEIDDRYGKSSVVVGEFAIEAGIEDARNRSSPSWMRFLGLTGGNSTESTWLSATTARARLGQGLTLERACARHDW